MVTTPLHAATSVGKVIISIGTSTAVKAGGNERKLKRRAEIFEGDLIKTGDNAKLQVRFIDGQLVALKANTEFKIEEYKYKGKQDGSEQASMSLFKGGMRAITGAIGKANKANYKLKTPVATLGVRGTHYGLFFCPSNCGVDANGNERKPGLYGGVVDGEVVLTNNGGQLGVGNDQYFYIPGLNIPPSLLLVPPSNVFGGDKGPDDGENAEISGGPATETNDDSPLEDDGGGLPGESDPIEVQLNQGDGVFASTYVASAPLFYATAENTGASTSAYADGVGAGNVILGTTLTGIDNVLVGFSYSGTTLFESCGPCTFGYGAATLTEVGGIASPGVNWGTWNGGYVFTADGVNAVSTNDYFSYIYSPNITAARPTTGSFDYVAAGGPPLRDEFGSAYSLNGFISIDFDIQEIYNVSLFATNGTRDWDLYYSGEGGVPLTSSFFTVPLFTECYGGSCSDGLFGNGEITGALVGQNAEGLIGSISGQAGSIPNGPTLTGVQYFEQGIVPQ